MSCGGRATGLPDTTKFFSYIAYSLHNSAKEIKLEGLGAITGFKLPVLLGKSR